MPDGGTWLPVAESVAGLLEVGLEDDGDEAGGVAVVHDESRMPALRLKPKKAAADERVRVTVDS